MTGTTFLIVYVMGFLITLLILIKWGKQLGWGDYDPPHSNYDDDYRSNAQAWTSFSIGWILFVPVNILVFSYRGLLWLVEKIIEKNED